MTHLAMITTYPPKRCGIASYAFSLRKALLHLKTDWSIDIIAIDSPEVGYSFDDEVKQTISFSMTLHEVLKVAQYVNNSKISAVFIHYEPGLCGSFGFIRLMRMLSKPIVLILHNIPLTEKPNIKALVRYLAYRSIRIVSPLTSVVTICTQLYEINEHKLFVIPPPRLSLRPTEVANRETTKQLLGWKGRTILFTYGFISPGKGIELVLHALRHVVHQHPNILYAVMGEVHYHVKDQEGYKKHLVSLIHDLGLQNHVYFSPTYASEEQIDSYMSACNIYICPHNISSDDNQVSSATIAHALSFGRAVLSVPHLYAQEMLEEQRGLLFHPDPLSLADTLSTALEQPNLLSLIEQSVARIAPLLTWNHTASAYVQLVESFIDMKDTEP